MTKQAKTGEQTAVKQVSYTTKNGISFIGETLSSHCIDVTAIKDKGFNVIHRDEIDHIWINNGNIQIEFKSGERVFIAFDGEKKRD